MRSDWDRSLKKQLKFKFCNFPFMIIQFNGPIGTQSQPQGDHGGGEGLDLLHKRRRVIGHRRGMQGCYSHSRWKGTFSIFFTGAC